MYFGRYDDGVRRCNERVLHDGFANFSHWNLRSEGLSVEYHRSSVAIIDVNCNNSQLNDSQDILMDCTYALHYGNHEEERGCSPRLY